jgi:hemolysin D
VASIFVENGARVNKGDPLIELDPVDSWADLEGKARDLEASRAAVARRRAAIAYARAGEFRSGAIAFEPETNLKIRQREEDVLAADLAQLASSQASLEAQLREKVAMKERLTASIEARAKLIAVGKERVAMREALKNDSGGSRAFVIEAAQQLETQMVADANDRGQLIETNAAIQTLKHKIEEGITKFIADQSQKLSDEERKQNQALKDVVNARSKYDRTRLVSSIAGTVQQLTVTTIGQVVTSGESLMIIVPLDAPIEVEAFIENKDIGFIEPGQPAAVKIDAFPFTRYGTIDGTVRTVSRDAVDNRDSSTSNAAETSQRDKANKSPGENLVFPAIVTLAQSWISIDNKQIALSPGMGVTVEVKVKPRRVIDYVLSPLRELVFHSVHER